MTLMTRFTKRPRNRKLGIFVKYSIPDNDRGKIYIKIYIKILYFECGFTFCFVITSIWFMENFQSQPYSEPLFFFGTKILRWYTSPLRTVISILKTVV